MKDSKILKVKSQKDSTSLKSQDCQRVNQLYKRIKEFFLNSLTGFQTKHHSLTLTLKKILEFQESFNDNGEIFTLEKSRKFWLLKKIRIKITVVFLKKFLKSLSLIERRLLSLRRKLKSKICGVIKKEDFLLCSMDETSVDNELYKALEKKRLLSAKIIKLKETYSRVFGKMSELDIKLSMQESHSINGRRLKAEKLFLNIENYNNVLHVLDKRYSSSLKAKESLSEEEIKLLRDFYQIMRE